MRSYIFEHRETGERITIRARSAHDAWTVLRADHDHTQWLRVGVRGER